VKLLLGALAVIIIVVPGPGGQDPPSSSSPSGPPSPSGPSFGSGPCAVDTALPGDGTSADAPVSSGGSATASSGASTPVASGSRAAPDRGIEGPATPTPDASGSGHLSAPSVTLLTGRGPTVPVHDSAGLTAALAAAAPGQVIELADGHYAGHFALARPGRPGDPITLRGSRKAVLDGAAAPPGDTLRLTGADYWQVVGFTVTGGQRGIVVERTAHTVLSGLDVGHTGAEAVRMQAGSSHDVLQNSVVHDTGSTSPAAGAGLAVGSARADWPALCEGDPDRTDRDAALANTFRHTSAANIDVREESRGGLIAGNAFDGSGLAAGGGGAVLELRGVGYRVLDNVTSGAAPALRTGFRAQVATDPAGSGCGNTFTGNVFSDPLPGPQITLDPRCTTPSPSPTDLPDPTRGPGSAPAPEPTVGR
jgi:hypothetical protein